MRTTKFYTFQNDKFSVDLEHFLRLEKYILISKTNNIEHDKKLENKTKIVAISYYILSAL